MENKGKNFQNLKFVRLTQPEQFSLIPRILFEQVKGADFKVDRLYQFGPLLLASPLTFLYVLAEKEQLENGHAPVKGILWAEINPLSENLIVNAFSIDKEYQGDGAMEKVKEKLGEIKKENNIENPVITITTRPKAVEKAGWEHSNITVMEMQI